VTSKIPVHLNGPLTHSLEELCSCKSIVHVHICIKNLNVICVQKSSVLSSGSSTRSCVFIQIFVFGSLAGFI